MSEELQLRIHGEASLPTLIYLPGLHGDWTLIGSFRKVIGGRVRFVEITYPRTLTWSLDDYAATIEAALAHNGITRGWLLGESYGSQVLWAMVARGKFPAQGVILAGGFVKHPMRWAVRLAEKLTGRISTALFVRIVFGYAKIARFRYRRSPETLATIDEFVVRRTELDRRAAQHRLHLIAQYDPRPIASQTRLPVFRLEWNSRSHRALAVHPTLAQEKLSGLARLQNHPPRRPQRPQHRAKGSSEAGFGLDEPTTVAADISRLII